MSTIADPRYQSIDYTGYRPPLRAHPRRRSRLRLFMSRVYITPVDVAQLMMIGGALVVAVMVSAGVGR